jgi:tetratricopeptide (TPR) repeat protein
LILVTLALSGQGFAQEAVRGEAEREAKELIRLFPTYAPAHAELGRIYESSHRYEDAAEAYDEYLKLSPAPAANDAATNRPSAERAQPQEQTAQPERL